MSVFDGVVSAAEPIIEFVEKYWVWIIVGGAVAAVAILGVSIKLWIWGNTHG